MSLIDVVTPACPVCGETSVLPVDSDSYTAWRNGLLAQYAFPDKDADERETLISGCHSKCFEQLFGEEL